MQLHLKTRVTRLSAIIRILDLNLPIYNLVWYKGVVSLLHEASLVGSTEVFVLRALLVVSSVVRFGISSKIFKRIIK